MYLVLDYRVYRVLYTKLYKLFHLNTIDTKYSVRGTIQYTLYIVYCIVPRTLYLASIVLYNIKYDPIKYGKTIDRAIIIRLCASSRPCHI